MDRLEKARQLFLEALALQEHGMLQQAERLYQEALTLAPDRPSVMTNLATVYLQSKKYREAKRLCERLLELDPQDEKATIHLGICQVKLKSAQDALVSFDKVLKVRPEEAYALANRGSALLELERPEEALASCERALSIKPDFPEALTIHGNVLVKLQRPEEALGSYQRALVIKPDHPEALFNLGSTLLLLGREEEATATFRRAIVLRPHDADRYVSFGDALLVQNRWDEAIAEYQRALELNPASAQAQYGLACVHLFQQDFERAWPGYERRVDTEDYRKQSFRDNTTSLRLYESLPHWQGPGEPGLDNVAIWAEQGIGDQVLFSTLIPELNAAGVPFVYELDPRLLGPYRRAFPTACFVARQDPPHEALQRASRVLAVGSLPSLFRSARADFARQPVKLISARPGRAAHYRSRLETDGPGLKVAISWRTVRKHWWALKKSAPLADFAPMLKLSGVRFVDVQYGDTAAERSALEAAAGVRLVRFDDVDHYHDLEELLAILEACDLVITTSNATAHFAGALGKPTWLLYLADRAPFHYWAHRGDYRCAWYPSVEIVTAPQLTDWPSLVGYTAARLMSMAG